jgi:hypothetical protein
VVLTVVNVETNMYQSFGRTSELQIHGRNGKSEEVSLRLVKTAFFAKQVPNRIHGV